MLFSRIQKCDWHTYQPLHCRFYTNRKALAFNYWLSANNKHAFAEPLKTQRYRYLLYLYYTFLFLHKELIAPLFKKTHSYIPKTLPIKFKTYYYYFATDYITRTPAYKSRTNHSYLQQLTPSYKYYFHKIIFSTLLSKHLMINRCRSVLTFTFYRKNTH